MLKPLLAVLLLLSRVAPAGSYAWPDKPLRVIVAFPPGGMIDVFARIFQARLVEGLGQPVVIDNRRARAARSRRRWSRSRRPTDTRCC